MSISRHTLCAHLAAALLMALSSVAAGSFLTAEPDDYAVNTAISDTISVKLRNASYRPGHAEFNRSWRRIYAKAPDAYPNCGPSTGSLVLGSQYEHCFNGTNYGLRAWFVDTGNTFQPTSYVGFDICWASASASWSEGARVTAYGDNIDGQEVALFNRVYKPSGLYTSVDLFQPGIKWLQIICWNDPAYHRQQAFSVDAFRFVDSSGTAYGVPDGENIEAPAGMSLGADDSLSGGGSILGDLANGGVVRPGSSPGTLTVDGAYSQSGEGVLEIEIAGDQAELTDQLLVTGSADLAGILKIKLDGYVPAPGESFTILASGGCTGSFDSLLVEGAEMDFDIDYGEGGVVITAVPEPTSLGLLALGVIALLRRRGQQSRTL